MIMLGPYKIKVKSLEGNILVFRNVHDYSLDEGMIFFTDNKTKESKMFSTSQCEIQLEISDSSKRGKNESS